MSALALPEVNDAGEQKYRPTHVAPVCRAEGKHATILAGVRFTSSIAGTIAYGFAAPQPATTRTVRQPRRRQGPAQLLRSAQLAAIQGRSAECRAHVNRALIASPAECDPASPAHVAWIFGLLELGFGRVEAAIRQFEHCEELVAKSSGDRADRPAVRTGSRRGADRHRTRPRCARGG